MKFQIAEERVAEVAALLSGEGDEHGLGEAAFQEGLQQGSVFPGERDHIGKSWPKTQRPRELQQETDVEVGKILLQGVQG